VLIRSCIASGESSFSGYNYSDISVVVRIHSDIAIFAGYPFASIVLSRRVLHSNAALRFHVQFFVTVGTVRNKNLTIELEILIFLYSIMYFRVIDLL
jgi:hypothetical protein